MYVRYLYTYLSNALYPLIEKQLFRQQMQVPPDSMCRKHYNCFFSYRNFLKLQKLWRHFYHFLIRQRLLQNNNAYVCKRSIFISLSTSFCCFFCIFSFIMFFIPILYMYIKLIFYIIHCFDIMHIVVSCLFVYPLSGTLPHNRRLT